MKTVAEDLMTSRGLVSALFNIELPIVQAGMVWVSGGKLAAAASEAGEGTGRNPQHR